MSSLVYISDGSKSKLSIEQRREIAGMADVRFIKLIHKHICQTAREVIGFQNVTIKIHEKGGHRHMKAIWSTDITGKDISKGALQFEPDKMRRGIAYLPDSPFNRRKLAAAMYNGPWHIVDDRVREELKPVAELKQAEQDRIDLEKKVKVNEAKEAQATMTKEELLQEEIKRLKEKMELMTMTEKEYIPPSPVSNKMVVADVVSDERRELDVKIYNDSVKKVKPLVYKEMQELIAELKDEQIGRTGKENGWATTKRYQSEVKPALVNRALAIIELDNPDVYGRIMNGQYPDLGIDNKE